MRHSALISHQAGDPTSPTRKRGTHKPDAPARDPSTNGNVDFAKMTPAQKIAYHKARWDHILG